MVGTPWKSIEILIEAWKELRDYPIAPAPRPPGSEAGSTGDRP